MEEEEADAAGSEASFCLQKITITDYSKDDYQYEEVSADDEFSLQEGDEDLSELLQAVQEQAEDAHILASKSVLTSEKSVSETPEAMDDFFCNFLVSLGMSRTLDCFQTEWYELVERGAFTAKDIGFVPTVYTCNQELKADNMRLRKDLDNYKCAANKAKEAFLKMQKERDFHRMHHKQVVQEKNRLICDMKRLKAHYASYEPVLKQMTEKYQSVLRQKMLTSLERDRAVGQVTGLQATLHNLESGCAVQIPVKKAGREWERKKGLEDPAQKALQEARQQKMLDVGPVNDSEKKRYPKDSEFPVDTQVNPSLAGAKKYSRSLKYGEYKLSNTLKLHDSAVSCLASHPQKDMVVTGSDDRLWKMWALPDGDIIMVGEGHSDWVSGCCFHPSGTHLITSSGDTTVRIWDLSKGGCVLTLEGHGQAVWDCSWHSCGDFVASASKDSTSKIWDVNSERCRYTMRGHKDSVSSIEFLPFSNTVLTSSADKTLSLWDARTGLRVYTFYGHLHSCNHATFSLEGNMIASCDTDGALKLWDVRQAAPIMSVDTGPRSANQLAFDHSASMELKEDNSCHFLQFPIIFGGSGAWKAFLQPAALCQVGHSILTMKICFIFWTLQQLKAGSTVQCSFHVLFRGLYFGKATHFVCLGRWHVSNVENMGSESFPRFKH
ncbi:sperm-associated antigen 16 protein isoform X5 [Numida meleagris]|uniref:sperm-associated antigen 16 protein isoform X5 n=1 Tax=Numida meleagris TaxID=8996 RepID=UPI000B3DF585|nr:sperm-associated antigen 16 protein isoform X5 [Numida meleagris]